MSDRKLNLIVTDADIHGSVCKYGLLGDMGRLFSPGLARLLDSVQPHDSAICTIHSPEDVDTWKLWNRRDEFSISNYHTRPDDHFIFNYQNPRHAMTIQGSIKWPCAHPESDDYSRFHAILGGTDGTQERMSEPRMVRTVVDCTDHPLMKAMLEGFGYDVSLQYCLDRKWPERRRR